MVAPITLRCLSMSRITMFAACVLVGITTASAQARGQQRHLPQDPVEVHNRFQSAIDALAVNWHIAIVAESAPIMEKAGADLSASLAKETVDQAVARIAAAFDYSVKHKGHVFILNKLFTDPEDLPDVTLEEASAALEEMLRILPSVEARYLPRMSGFGGSAMRSVLTRDQLSALDHGGVPVSSLTEDQRAETWRVAEAMQYSQVIDEVRESSYFINGSLAHDPEFHWVDFPPDYKEFGFDAVVVSKFANGETHAHTMLKPLSHPVVVSVWSDGNSAMGRMVTATGEPESDPTEPDFHSVQQSGKMAAMVHVDSLADTIARINMHTSKDAMCVVDKELADKSLTVAGDSNAPPAEVAFALAETYGLSARHRMGGGITIARRTAPRVNGPSEVNSALVTVIPDTVLRCTKARMTTLCVGVDAARVKSHPWLYGHIGVGRQISAAAKRQIRTVAQPLAPEGADNRIALSKLPAGSRGVFAVSQSVEAFISALEMCDRGSPIFLLDFDHAVLQGSFVVNPNESTLTLKICATDPNTGGRISTPGFTTSLITGGLTFPPQPALAIPLNGQYRAALIDRLIKQE